MKKTAILVIASTCLEVYKHYISIKLPFTKNNFQWLLKDKRNGGCAPLYETQNAPVLDGHE